MIAKVPDVMSLSNIVSVLLTRTLPSSSVQSKKFPFFRIGYIIEANFCSDDVPDFMTIWSSIGSKDINPRFSPENIPDNKSKTHMKII